MSTLKESLVYDTFEPPSHSLYEVMDSIPPPPQPFIRTPDYDEYSKVINISSASQTERSYSIETLYELWLAKLHIIDKELASEFSVTNNN
jgi:hypothetical protein